MPGIFQYQLHPLHNRWLGENLHDHASQQKTQANRNSFYIVNAGRMVVKILQRQVHYDGNDTAAENIDSKSIEHSDQSTAQCILTGASSIKERFTEQKKAEQNPI